MAEPSPMNVIASSVEHSQNSSTDWIDWTRAVESDYDFESDYQDSLAYFCHLAGGRMFSETIFKPNLVAVRELTSWESERMTVSIYRRDPLRGIPELIYGSLRMRRTFEESIAGMIRHSANWINKLDREGISSDYWNEELEEWRVDLGEPDLRCIFLNQPASAIEFMNRVESLTAQAAPTARSSEITPQALHRILHNALRDTFPVGVDETRVKEAFVRRLKEELGRTHGSASS